MRAPPARMRAGPPSGGTAIRTFLADPHRVSCRIDAMTRRLSRRQALGALGTVSLGALLGRVRERASDQGRHDGRRHGDRRAQDRAGAARWSRSSTRRAPARRPPSRPRARTTSTPTRSAPTSARTATGTPLALALRVRDAATTARRSRTRSSTSGTATRAASTPASSPARASASCAARRPPTRTGIAQLHDDLPRLVPGPHGAHPRQGPPRPADRADDAAVLRRRGQRPRPRGGRLRGRGERSQRNDSDGIFDDSLLLTLERSGDGYLGLMNFDVARA